MAPLPQREHPYAKRRSNVRVTRRMALRVKINSLGQRGHNLTSGLSAVIISIYFLSASFLQDEVRMNSFTSGVNSFTSKVNSFTSKGELVQVQR